MYTVYADDICIYNSRSVEKESRLIDPVLTLEENYAGSFEFSIPPSNIGYSLIQRMTSEIVVKRNNTEIWSGRVLSEESDFYNIRKLYCEGELAYLNDTVQPQAEYHDITVRGFLETLLTNHNSKVTDNKKFYVGIVTVTDTNDSLYRYTNFENTFDCISDKLVGRLGGRLRVRKVNGTRYLDYLNEYPNTNSQTINFGENLLDFTKEFEHSDFATVILPLGAMLDESPIEALEAYTDVSSVNGGSLFVASENALERYGRIEKVVHWDNVYEPENLLSKAEEYLRDIQFEKMTLAVKALDLQYMGVDAEEIKLLDEIRVISPPHGIDRLFPVTKLTVPLDTPEDTEFVMGAVQKLSLTEVNNRKTEEFMALIDDIPSTSEILESAKDNATQLIQDAVNGYVTIRSGENGTQELLITNTPDYANATKVWRWNINGLGYSSNGYNGTYGLAMTMDGSIVADRVTTGTMYADRIRGGTLSLGGANNADGVLMVKNANGEIVCLMNCNGAYVNGSIHSVNNNGYWLDVEDGTIRGGRNEYEYGFINATAVIHNNDTGEDHAGFVIKSDGIIIACNELATIDTLDETAESHICANGILNVVTDITDNGDGTITWSTLGLRITNGMITSTL